MQKRYNARLTWRSANPIFIPYSKAVKTHEAGEHRSTRHSLFQLARKIRIVYPIITVFSPENSRRNNQKAQGILLSPITNYVSGLERSGIKSTPAETFILNRESLMWYRVTFRLYIYVIYVTRITKHFS